MGEKPVTLAVRYAGDRTGADRMRLKHGVRVMQEFERLTYFQRLVQNERTIRFDDGSWIHLQTRFGDRFATFYAPPTTTTTRPQATDPQLLTYFRAYRADSTPVWVLCLGGMNFGPPYEILDVEFERQEWTRTALRGNERFTILPHLNPAGSYSTGYEMRTIGSHTVPPPVEYVTATIWEREDVLFVNPTAQPGLDNALYEVDSFAWNMGQYDPPWGAYWVFHRSGTRIYSGRQGGAVSDTDSRDYGAITSTIPYQTEEDGPQADDSGPATLAVYRNGTSANLGDYYLPLAFAGALQEGGFFSWGCATNKGLSGETPLRGFRLGLMDGGGILADTIIPVNEATRTFTTSDGTELLFEDPNDFWQLSYVPIVAEDWSQGIEPTFGVIKREVFS